MEERWVMLDSLADSMGVPNMAHGLGGLWGKVLINLSSAFYDALELTSTKKQPSVEYVRCTLLWMLLAVWHLRRPCSRGTGCLPWIYKGLQKTRKLSNSDRMGGDLEIRGEGLSISLCRKRGRSQIHRDRKERMPVRSWEEGKIWVGV